LLNDAIAFVWSLAKHLKYNWILVRSWQESLLHLHYELGAKKTRSPPLLAAITSELILTCSPLKSFLQKTKKGSSRIKK
jgi:hypothetical protein